MPYSGPVRKIDDEILINTRNNQSWDDFFMLIADLVSTRSTCLSRHAGAIIVRDKQILSTGYNGASKGVKNCVERGFCRRIKNGYKSGEKLEDCYAAHAEVNAALQAAKHGVSIDKATLYSTTSPCTYCAKEIINTGINEIVYMGSYPHKFAIEMLEEAGVKLRRYTKNLDKQRENLDVFLNKLL